MTDEKKWRLEGYGRMQYHGRGYPAHPPKEVLKIFPAAITVLTKWKREHRPFRPKEWTETAVAEKQVKFDWIAKELAKVYRIDAPKVVCSNPTKESWTSTGAGGHYDTVTNTIQLYGKYSVVTFLHEFGHARGFDEGDATLWSVNVFRTIFPQSFKRATSSGHLVVKRQERSGEEV
jgi:hypothetical protein